MMDLCWRECCLQTIRNTNVYAPRDMQGKTVKVSYHLNTANNTSVLSKPVSWFVCTLPSTKITWCINLWWSIFGILWGFSRFQEDGWNIREPLWSNLMEMFLDKRKPLYQFYFKPECMTELWNSPGNFANERREFSISIPMLSRYLEKIYISYQKFKCR